MCGFAGKFNLNSLGRTSYLDKQFDKAYKRLRSRGPDDKGIWVDKNIYLLVKTVNPFLITSCGL